MWAFFILISQVSADHIWVSEVPQFPCESICAHHASTHPWAVSISHNETMRAWDTLIFETIHGMARDFLQATPSLPNTLDDTGYMLLRLLPENGTIPPHFDPYSCAVVNVILLLNDNVGGGELWWPVQNKRVAPQCGTVVFWPNAYTHPLGIDRVRVGALHFIQTSFRIRRE